MATTTNYGWTTPDDTDLVKDGAAAIRTLGSSVDTTTKALNPETTTGDIAYRSATANTNTRLALGTAGQVLTVNTGATAPEWATPAGGGGMTLLSTTTLSGAGTTISSISQDYVNLQIFLIGVDSTTDGKYLEANLNGTTNLTDGNYFAPTSTGSGKSFDNVSSVPYFLDYNSPMLNGNTANSFNLSVLNYASTTDYKAMSSSATFITSGTTRRFENGSGYFRSTSAITSIQFRMHGSGVTTNFSGGTVLIYGVK
jgi:hypothetical protein